MTAKTFAAVEKFNPYHDRLGRFSSAGAAASFTFRTKDPKKQHMADMAVAREKERAKNMGGAASSYGLSQEQYDDLMNSSLFQFREKARQYGMDKETADRFSRENNLSERRKERMRQREAEKRAEEKRQNAELDERIKQELPGLDQNAISRANSVSMFDHGSVAARDAMRRVDAYRDKNKIQDDWNDEQKAYARQREEEYKQLITEYYNDSNNRFANNPSWAVTGRANYNVKRSEKLSQAANNKANEYEEKLKRFEDNTRRGIEQRAGEAQQIARWRQGKWNYGETISSDDPLASKKLQAKLEYQQESQQRMKDANAYYRKNGSMKGFEGFSESTNTKIDAAMSSSRSSKPFASYELTNNNAQIKATQQRLAQQQKLDASRTSGSKSGGSAGGFSFKGGNVVQNTGINRLQIKFDSIPDASMRAKLKSEGWRWSPREGAWQRQLTDNAERSAKRILGE